MILVFGRNGQVAQALQEHSNIIAIDRLEADLQQPNTCWQVINHYKPTAVINAAAYTAVDMAELEEDKANIINGEAPRVMAQCCANRKIPFVHLSTDYVFEGSGEIAWKPDDPVNPQNAYGRSKLRGEKAIQKFGLIYAIVRTSWIISSHGTNFVKTMINLSKTKENLQVVSDQIGNPTPAADIANTCIKIVKQLKDDPSKSGIYHFSGKPDISWCDFANTIFKLSNIKSYAYPIKSNEYPTIAKRPLNSSLNCEKTKSIFEIAQPCWHSGLKKIIKEII